VRVDLRKESVAAIVLDASAAPHKAQARAPRRALAEESLAAIALGARSPQRGLLLSALFVVAVALHAAAGFSALGTSRQGIDAAPIPVPKPAIRIEHVVELAPPGPPPPEPAPPEPSPPPPVAEARPVERAPTPPPPTPDPPSDAPPPAEAGQVVAADESASAPLDFTGFGITTGTGPRYAGKVTSGPGTNRRAVAASRVDRRAAPTARAGTTRARPVGAPRRNWDCPWPAEADALSINEQSVVLRALVRADGTVASAELLADPGHGFGQAALACVRRQRFPAATDHDGNPITATSPPIRVRFTR